MGRKYVIIMACALLAITIACGGSDDVEPAVTLAPTLELQEPKATTLVTPESTLIKEPTEEVGPESTDTAAPTNTVEPEPTEEPPPTKAPTDTAAPPTETNTPMSTETIALPTDTPLPTNPPATNTPIPTEAPPTDTPLPTNPPVTDTPLPTSPPPPTDTPLPTDPPPPTEPVVGGQIVIIAVDKRAEYVDLQNTGGQPQDISGWVLVSEKGDQRCNLSGVVEPNAVLRVWALASDAGQGGYNCGFGSNIWNNSEPDAAVLYDNAGNPVARYP